MALVKVTDRDAVFDGQCWHAPRYTFTERAFARGDGSDNREAEVRAECGEIVLMYALYTADDGRVRAAPGIFPTKKVTAMICDECGQLRGEVIRHGQADRRSA